MSDHFSVETFVKELKEAHQEDWRRMERSMEKLEDRVRTVELAQATSKGSMRSQTVWIAVIIGLVLNALFFALNRWGSP